MYDLTADPMKPKYLFNTAGSGKSCHDSSVVEDVGGRDLLIVSDGSGRCQRIYDITSVSASTTKVPPLIGQTSQISGIYAHSNWISEDKRYLFSWDENNVIDISVHDVVDPGSPKQIALFQYSDNAKNNAIPHNGQVKVRVHFVLFPATALWGPFFFDLAVVSVGLSYCYRFLISSFFIVGQILIRCIL